MRREVIESPTTPAVVFCLLHGVRSLDRSKAAVRGQCARQDNSLAYLPACPGTVVFSKLLNGSRSYVLDLSRSVHWKACSLVWSSLCSLAYKILQTLPEILFSASLPSSCGSTSISCPLSLPQLLFTVLLRREIPTPQRWRVPLCQPRVLRWLGL